MSFLGIDIGTTTVCGAVLDDDGRFIESVTRDNTFLSTGIPYEKIQSPDGIVKTVREIVAELTAKHVIHGIGLSGQMHGILYTDKDGNAVSPLYIWQDGRGGLPYKDGKSYAEVIGAKPGYGGATHFYNTVNHLVPETAVKLCTVGDYAAMKLSGNTTPVTDVTNAASLGLFDLEKGCFDTEKIASFGIDAAMFPTVTPSFTCVGNTGNNIPVYNCIGDNQASFLGSVADKERSILINIGTGSQISVYSEAYRELPHLETRPFPGGGYLHVGASLCGGRAYALLMSFFAEAVKIATGKEISKPYAAFEELTNALDEADLPDVKPLFCGTREDTAVRGSITNLTEDNFTPAAMAAAMLRGIVTELYEMYAPSQDVLGERPVIVGSGNGVRSNRVMKCIVHDLFDAEFTIPVYKEEAACGAARAAMSGAIQGGIIGC